MEKQAITTEKKKKKSYQWDKDSGYDLDQVKESDKQEKECTEK